jgi:hypothetical protein
MKPATVQTLALLVAFSALAACSTPQASNATTAAGTQAASTPAPAAPATPGTVTGTVAETMNSGGYTYMRLQTGQKDVWIAANEFPVTKGESVTAPLEMPMENFHSTTLNRDFPLIYFVAQVARAGQPLQGASGAAAAPGLMPMASHGVATASPAPQAAAAVAVQPNAAPAGGLSIADTWAKRDSLSGKTVIVRGTVVKVNNGILGFNWLHLQDGSGKASDGTNDLTVTTDALAKVGDVVTVSGTLAVKKDFGAGYAYEAILEKATIK